MAYLHLLGRASLLHRSIYQMSAFWVQAAASQGKMDKAKGG
jgi:hypothetical protein